MDDPIIGGSVNHYCPVAAVSMQRMLCEATVPGSSEVFLCRGIGCCIFSTDRWPWTPGFMFHISRHRGLLIGPAYGDCRTQEAKRQPHHWQRCNDSDHREKRDTQHQKKETDKEKGSRDNHDRCSIQNAQLFFHDLSSFAYLAKKDMALLPLYSARIMPVSGRSIALLRCVLCGESSPGMGQVGPSWR